MTRPGNSDPAIALHSDKKPSGLLSGAARKAYDRLDQLWVFQGLLCALESLQEP
ncbi:MAG TPA: hypothetical protein VLB04_09165 [Methanotrichaceae archaeon]|nr:hypothetical protein [Methanotrichaceae archaeon]